MILLLLSLGQKLVRLLSFVKSLKKYFKGNPQPDSLMKLKPILRGRPDNESPSTTPNVQSAIPSPWKVVGFAVTELLLQAFVVAIIDIVKIAHQSSLVSLGVYRAGQPGILLLQEVRRCFAACELASKLISYGVLEMSKRYG